MDRSTLVIGTRGSPLALRQAHEVADRLAAALGWDEAQLPLSVIKTTGDAIQDRPLSEAGGKGLFTKELDAALLDGAIDLAVHSAKDLPTALAGRSGDCRLSAARGCARRLHQQHGAEPARPCRRARCVGSASLRRQAHGPARCGRISR